jgi:protein-S-isoprenylcysteine O-methyltransferase Ste14
MKKSLCSLYIKIAVRLLFFFPIVGMLIFLPAGTLNYWEAWAFIAVFFACNLGLTGYLVFKDPKLLERRMKVGPAAEKTMTQKIIVVLAFVFFAGVAVVPALDHRFGWSDVPASVAVLGNLLIVVSYFGFYRVLRENTYAAATIQVEEGQKVISTGPYTIVRHPMYGAALIMSLGIVLALGSWAGLLSLVPGILVVVWRLLDEEKVLCKDLSGYTEYTRKVRWRLIPWIL